MNRKNFISNLALLGIGGPLLAKKAFAALGPEAEPALLEKIGVQLFSLPASLEKDFRGTLGMLAGLGYKEIELFGPYPYSDQRAKDRWQQITPMLGFSGSGYFGHSEKELKSIFKEYSLEIPAMHTDLDTLEHHMHSLGEASQTLGFTYVILPAIPEERRKTPDDYKKMADTFNSIGKQAKKAGLRFAYHNHGYGLSEVEGQRPLHLILDNTDPELVFFEMDLFWTLAGRADPLEYLQKYSGRYRLMHVKDMKQNQTFAGDGGDASQWMALFPNMTAAGEGVVDLRTIIPFAKEHGVQHFFVEQDLVSDPATALKKSIDFLKEL